MVRGDRSIEPSAPEVWNNGKGLPIEMHKEHQCYVPELVFGHLLTSDNYDDQEKKAKITRLRAVILWGLVFRPSWLFGSLYDVNSGLSDDSDSNPSCFGSMLGLTSNIPS